MFEQLSSKQLVRAAQLKERIEGLEAELAEILSSDTRLSGSSTSGANVSGKSAQRKGPISAEGKARIVAAQKARWAKFRKERGLGSKPASASAGAPRRTMSAAAKAKIRAVAKARWAKAKAAGRTTL
jgi:hypothetical protein